MRGFRLEPPSWLEKELRRGRACPDDRDKAAFVVGLSELNVLRGTGGPFGAAVFEEPGGRLISAGVNAVILNGCSLAHAEIMALGLAQKKTGRPRLNSRPGRSYVLASSSQPCAMCWGAMLWAGVDRVLFSALKSDVERLTGFDEGALPKRWRSELGLRGIQVRSGLLRSEACRVLRLYKEKDGRIY
ncbi:MAG: nucleoside deaminase [Candidatus Aminicenantes bacterium]|nr:nucleoside deaminase [Candidatus Aminicenantes bacterium]